MQGSRQVFCCMRRRGSGVNECDIVHNVGGRSTANIDLNELIATAKKVGGHKTKKAAITAALEEYIRRHKQQEAISAFGTIDFDPAYDYKAERKTRRE